MPKLALTDIAVRGLKPTSPQQTYWDAAMPNFGVRVGLRSKSFVLLVGNERRRITLGAYPAMSLAQARQAARGHMAERVLGIAAPPKPKSPSFSEALTSFIGDRQEC